MTRIEKKFRELRKTNKKAFVTFITAGYPDLRITEKLILEFDRIGVDILELGVPFSDPMADGPVIQEASRAALKKKVHLEAILELVKKARRHTQMPICIMTYYNPIFCFGEKRFIEKAKVSGVDGVIVPDLPPEEATQLHKLALASGINLICFIAPTTSLKRMRYIAAVSKGFIYYVSLTGVTGARQALPEDLVRNLRIIKGITDKPVCVGFGVSQPEQVRKIKKLADGVIIGSAIVRKIRDNIGKPQLVKRVGDFVRYLKGD